MLSRTMHVQSVVWCLIKHRLTLSPNCMMLNLLVQSHSFSYTITYSYQLTYSQSPVVSQGHSLLFSCLFLTYALQVHI